MKVFIAYSGETAKKLAAQIRRWLPLVLPKLQPYFAETDIMKSSDWRRDIHDALRKADASLLCLTKEGLNRPWIQWEAGQSKRVFPLLFGVSADELQSGPLGAIQSTTFEHDDMLRLVKGLNELSPRPSRPTDKPTRAFERAWPKLESVVKKILGAQAKDMVEQMHGAWWERITSPQELTAISFLQIEPEGGKKTLRLRGTAYDAKGRPVAQWESQIVLVDPERVMLAYLWEGDWLTTSGDNRRGIGQINFIKSRSGRLESGQGAFDDTNMRDVYQRKMFRLARATPREETVMTGRNDRAKTALVKKKLRQMG